MIESEDFKGRPSFRNCFSALIHYLKYGNYPPNAPANRYAVAAYFTEAREVARTGNLEHAEARGTKTLTCSIDDRYMVAIRENFPNFDPQHSFQNSVIITSYERCHRNKVN